MGVGQCSFVRPRLGKLNVKHLIMLHKVNFYRRLLKSCDTFLCDVFLTFLSDNVCSNDVLMPVFFVLGLMLLTMYGYLLRTM